MMSVKKSFSLFLAFAVLLVGLLVPNMSVAKPDGPPVGQGDRATRAWPDPPASARDVRQLVYRASRAGKRQESMTLGSAVMSRAGITLEGVNCRKGAVWLTFSEKARTRRVGGRLCDGSRSFKRRPNYGRQRFKSLLSHVASKVLAGLRIDILQVGTPLLIRADGKRALVLFDRFGGKGVHPIRAIRFNGSKRTVERF